MQTLYQRVGGEAAVLAVATSLYDKLLRDPSVAPFFAGLDMDAMVRKQTAFLAWAFGSEERYAYRALPDAHRELVRKRGLSNHHFDVVAKHLHAALGELGVEPDLIAEVMALVETTRAAVLAG